MAAAPDRFGGACVVHQLFRHAEACQHIAPNSVVPATLPSLRRPWAALVRRLGRICLGPVVQITSRPVPSPALCDSLMQECLLISRCNRPRRRPRPVSTLWGTPSRLRGSSLPGTSFTAGGASGYPSTCQGRRLVHTAPPNPSPTFRYAQTVIAKAARDLACALAHPIPPSAAAANSSPHTSSSAPLCLVAHWSQHHSPRVVPNRT